MTGIATPVGGVGVTGTSECPYRGLRSYTEADGEYFFARETARDLVVANLMASRLTVLYGPSGVGKSSLLQAGVMRQLRRAGEEAFSFLAADAAVIAYASAWRGDPLVELGSVLVRGLPEDSWSAALVRAQPQLSVELLQEVSEHLNADIYLLLDQFEELALYQTGPAGDAFDGELGRILAVPGLRVSVLISVRDDALATLDRLEAHVPGLFDNNLRLGHLSRAGGREAIEQPLARYNQKAPPDQSVDIEPELVEDLLTQLRTGAVPVTDDSGVGSVSRSDQIEAPFLQLVMTRLWAAEHARDSRTLTQRTLRELGGVGQIIRSHLDAVMSDLGEPDREIAAGILRYLVTPSGMKISHTVQDLADYVALGETAVLAVVEQLASGRERVLRPVPAPAGSEEAPRYEIFHDVMAPAVLDWRRRYVAERERLAGEESLVRAKHEAEAGARATQRRLRRSRIGSACLAILLATTSISLYDAVRSKQSAVAERLHSNYERLHAEYLEKLTNNPADSLKASVEAYDTEKTPESESAVRIAFEADNERLRLKADSGPLFSSKFSPDGKTLLTAGTDGVAKLFDTRTGALLRSFAPPESGSRPTGGRPDSPPQPHERLWTTLFSPAGEYVATVTAGGRIRLFETATGYDLGVIGRPVSGTSAFWGVRAGVPVLLVSDGSGPAQLWDARSRKILARFGTKTWGATLSGDGSHVVAIDIHTEVHRLAVWDAGSGRLLKRSRGLDTIPDIPRFIGRHGDRVAFFMQKAEFGRWRPTFWSWRNGPVRFDLADAESRTSARLVVSDDGQFVAAPLDKRVRVYNAETLRQVGQTPESPDWVNQSVAMSANGRWLATSGGDGRARLWLAQHDNNQPVAELIGDGSAIVDIQFDPTNLGGLATAGDDGLARIWALPEREILHGSGGWVLSTSLDSHGTTLVTGEDTGVLHTSAVDKDDPERAAKERQTTFSWYGSLRDAMFTPDGTKVIVADVESSAPAVWNWRDERSAWSLEFSDRPIVAFAPSHDSSRVAAADADGRILVWDLATEKIVARIPSLGEAASVSHLVGLAGSTLFAAASDDGTIRLWDTEQTQAPQRTFGNVGDAPVTSLRVSRDGAYLASLSASHAVQIWRLSDGERVGRLDGPPTSNTDLAFSWDGTLVAVAAGDGAVHVWRWADGQQLAVLHRHGDLVNSVDFTPDGRLISGSDDATTAIYPCTTCGDFDELLAEARDRIASRR